MIIAKYGDIIILELLYIREKEYCLMEQKIDNIYRSYKDNDNIDSVLFDIYEIILAKLDNESFEDV
jgi:hypothetical protein